MLGIAVQTVCEQLRSRLLLLVRDLLHGLCCACVMASRRLLSWSVQSVEFVGVCTAPWIHTLRASVLCAELSMLTSPRYCPLADSLCAAQWQVPCNVLHCSGMSQVCEQLHFFLQKAFPTQYKEREKDIQGNTACTCCAVPDHQ